MKNEKTTNQIKIECKRKNKMLKLGLFGGSFNPAHAGHYNISIIAVKKFNLYKLFWLVVPENPFKKNSETLPLQKRIKVANTFLRNQKKVKAIDFESDLKTFETYNTIKKALRLFPNMKIFWIMGSDNLFHFDLWKNSDFIAKNVNFIIFPRNNFHKALRTESFIKYKNKMHFLNVKKFNISSTKIRENLGLDWQKNFE